MTPPPALSVFHVIEAMKQGGAESVVVEHVRHAGPDVRVTVCAINGGGPAFEAARANGAEAIDLSAGRRPSALGRIGRIQRLASLLRERRPAVVNAHNPTAALYGTPAARLAGVPVVVRTEHSIHEAGRHSSLYAMVEPALTAATSAVVCVCEAARVSHASRLPRWADRFVTIANGVSESPPLATRDQTRRALGIGADERVVLTVGSLTTQKAQHVMIEAFGRLVSSQGGASGPAPVRLVIAGDGPLRSALQSQAAGPGLGDRVQFLGARNDTPDLMNAADVFVLSSAREGLPITILEAMRAGLPVVATRAGGCAEVVWDGETGRLAPIGDVAALAAAIGDLIARPDRAAAMGAAGRGRWSERFTAERMVRETTALYHTLLARTGAGSRTHAITPSRPVEPR